MWVLRRETSGFQRPRFLASLHCFSRIIVDMYIYVLVCVDWIGMPQNLWPQCTSQSTSVVFVWYFNCNQCRCLVLGQIPVLLLSLNKRLEWYWIGLFNFRATVDRGDVCVCYWECKAILIVCEPSHSLRMIRDGYIRSEWEFGRPFASIDITW